MRGRRIVSNYYVRSPYKRVVKTMRYKMPKYTARSILKSGLSNATLTEVNRIVQHECELLCKKIPTPSYLRVSDIKDLSTFKWEVLMAEISSIAPTLTSILSAAAQRSQSEIVHICMVVAVLLKFRCKHMCKVQLIVSTLLYAGHAAKKVN